jgi:GNAT superfamily N-acetyltransferase
MSTVSVVTFDPKYRLDYKTMNLWWIEKWFKVEEKDILQLEAPEECLAEGGQIFFTLVDGRPMGTCALYKIGERRYELAKMGVHPESRGHGLGDRLMEAAEKWAREQKATEIMLQSNTILEPAISLYKKHGYKEVEIATPSEYARCNIEMVKPLV